MRRSDSSAAELISIEFSQVFADNWLEAGVISCGVVVSIVEATDTIFHDLVSDHLDSGHVEVVTYNGNWESFAVACDSDNLEFGCVVNVEDIVHGGPVLSFTLLSAFKIVPNTLTLHRCLDSREAVNNGGLNGQEAICVVKHINSCEVWSTRASMDKVVWEEILLPSVVIIIDFCEIRLD